MFVLGHFLGFSLLVSTLMFFLVGRVLGRRKQGLFGPPTGGEENLEFGYCFDVRLPFSTTLIAEPHGLTRNLQVSIRAFLPVWAFLYALQFLLMPLIAQDYWVSNLFGNTMYLMAWSYYFVITFLGYNGELCLTNLYIISDESLALPYLSRTEVLLSPIPIVAILWFISLFTFDCATNLAPVLWCGVNLRKPV